VLSQVDVIFCRLVSVWFGLSGDIPLHEANSPENAARAYTQVLKTK